ncbi:MAG: hypothetical protein ACYSVY_25890 [Planctomycetota bacterium]|jgi:hypothetical protein
MDGQTERRAHRRLAINLPLECSPVGAEPGTAYRTVSVNVSSDGLHFVADADVFRKGMLLDVELGVPPGGHFPYAGRVQGRGKVVRVDELAVVQKPNGSHPRRFGIAAHFSEPLKVVFQTER